MVYLKDAVPDNLIRCQTANDSRVQRPNMANLRNQANLLVQSVEAQTQKEARVRSPALQQQTGEEVKNGQKKTILSPREARYLASTYTHAKQKESSKLRSTLRNQIRANNGS